MKSNQEYYMSPFRADRKKLFKHKHSAVKSHSVIFTPVAGKEEKGSRSESKKERGEEKREIMRGYEMRGEKER